MKKIVLSVLAIVALQLAQAQQDQTIAQPKQAPTPEQIAARQSMHLQKVLGLSDEQKQKVYQAAFSRSTSMQQLKSKDVGNRKELRADAKPVREQFVKDVNATLTPDQQKKWEEYRLKQKQNQEQRKQQASPASNTNTSTPAKLESSDDGMNDK